MASGPCASAAGFCATARISPVDGLIATIIACLPVVLTAFWAAFCTARSRLIVTDGAGSPGTSLSTSTSTPFWLTLTTRQPAWPSSSSTTAFLTSPMMAGANVSSVGSSSACAVITTPGSVPIAAATRSWSDWRRVIETQRLLRRAGLLGEELGIQRVVERPQRIDDGPRCRHQRPARRLGVQREVVQIAGHQHVTAAAFVHRGAPGRVRAQRQRLVLAELGVQPGGAPAHLPTALVADQVQLPVVGPGAVLGQVPGVAVGDAAGVLGVLRAQDLRVEVGRLQPRPRVVERLARIGGPVAQFAPRPPCRRSRARRRTARPSAQVRWVWGCTP